MRKLGCLAIAVWTAVLASCAGTPAAKPEPEGVRLMQAEWIMHIDAERSVKAVLDGSFTATEDKTRAPAGETNVYVETFGNITYTNLSDGRETGLLGERLDGSVEIRTPLENCPDTVRVLADHDIDMGRTCGEEIYSMKVPALMVDETVTKSIANKKRLSKVLTDEAPLIIDGLHGPRGVLVVADRWATDVAEELNPTCELDKGGLWITYFTEDSAVTACD